MPEIWKPSPPGVQRPKSQSWSRKRTIAVALDALRIVAGMLGLAAVGLYWNEAACPLSSSPTCPRPVPLNQPNSTIITVGATVSVGFFVLGGVVAFVAGYFPDSSPPIQSQPPAPEPTSSGAPSPGDSTNPGDDPTGKGR